MELEREAQDTEVIFYLVVTQTFRKLPQTEWHKCVHCLAIEVIVLTQVLLEGHAHNCENSVIHSATILFTQFF